MKIADIADQLLAEMPQYTDLFTNVTAFLDAVVSGNTVTFADVVDTSLIIPGNRIRVTASLFINDIATITDDGDDLWTLTTSKNHDLTLGYPGFETVELFSADGDWSGDFTLVDVPNRKSLQIKNTDASAVPTQTVEMHEIRSVGIDTVLEVISVSASTIIATFDGSGVSDGTYKGGSIEGRPRITSVVNVERAIQQYTPQAKDSFWMFVYPNNPATVSKDRLTNTDANAEQGAGTDFREWILDNFTVAVVAPADQEAAASGVQDICRNDLLGPLLQSLRGFRPATGLACESPFRVTFTAHGAGVYSGPYYVHLYDFQFLEEMTVADKFTGPTVAFRDIDLTINQDTQKMTADIDLDDEPIAS